MLPLFGRGIFRVMDSEKGEEKMRLGVSTAFSHENGKEWAQKHKALGLGAVVFPLDYTASNEKIEEYVLAAKEADLVIAEVGVWKNVIAKDPKEREEAIKYAIGQLALADRIGARCCVNIVGAAAGSRWDGGVKENYSEATWQKIVSSIQQIVDAVKPKKTKYTIEPMPWMVPSSPEEYIHLLKDIDREEVGVHLDLVNMIHCPERFFFQEEFMEKCFSLLGEKICSCHLKDIRLKEEYTFQLEEVACGEGSLNIELYAKLAQSQDDEMPMIIEHLENDQQYIEVLKYVQQRLRLEK